MVTRWERVAGVAGRIAAPPWKKNQEFTGQLCKAMGSSSGLDEQRGAGSARGARCAHGCPCGCSSCPLHPLLPHTHPCGWTGGVVCDTRVWLPVTCLEGCWCAGCSQEALWMLILYLIYSRESVVLQMKFAEDPKNGQTFAWIHFPYSISEFPTVSLGPGR